MNKLFLDPHSFGQYYGGLQYQQDGGRGKPISPLEKVITFCSGYENSNKSGTHPRSSERCSGRSESPRNERELSNKGRSSLEMPAATKLLSRDRLICKHNESSSREILFTEGKKVPKHARGRSSRRKCSPYLLDGDEAPNASPDTIDKQDSGKIFNGRRDRSDNCTRLERPTVKPPIKKIDSQKVPDGEDEECLSEGGGYEPEEFMPPPGSDVHPFVGKQNETYVHESIPERNGEIMRRIFCNIKTEDQTRGSLFFIGFE
jgi:hypothetical protein